VTFSVAEALDRYVEKIEEPREPDGFWHPSSLSGCDRKSLYEIRATPKTDERDGRSKRILRVGHIMHEFVQAALADYPGVRFIAEVPLFAGPLRIRGSADGLLVYLIEGEDGDVEALEFKTINSMAFKYGDLPKPDHAIQLSVYMKLLREYGATLKDGTIVPPLGPKLTRGRIVYVSKDDLRISEHTILWTEGKNRTIEDKLVVLESHLADGTLPDRLPDQVDKKTGKTKRAWLCGYCPYQTLCWGMAGSSGDVDVTA
jgi:CRISPR/Cas system-associated exonuclease Cas4 (RecB family)